VAFQVADIVLSSRWFVLLCGESIRGDLNPA
jgi:hypothetical protein